MIQNLQVINNSNYSSKNRYPVCFGMNPRSNYSVCDENHKDIRNAKLHTTQALLLTLAILASQNALLTNNPNQNISSKMEYFAEANSEINDNFIDTYEVSFNSPKIYFDKQQFNVVAHRGYTATAPENTLPAYIEAAKMGYSKVEADIAWTKDSMPVLLHDETINRTARYNNGFKPIFSKKCSDLTYDELLKYDFGSWKGYEYEGTKIPTLSNFLDCCKKLNLQPYIELKQTSNFDAKKAQILVDSVKKAGMEDSVTWISFNADYLKLISEEMPNSRLGYLSKDFSSEKTIKILKNLKTESNDVFLDIKAKAVSDEMKSVLAAAGFSFEAWAVDNAEDLIELLMINCSGITTDLLTNNHLQEIFSDMDDN